MDWNNLYDSEAPEIVLDKLKEVKETHHPEANVNDNMVLGFEDLQATPHITSKFHNKLENFDQVRFDLLHSQNVKVIEAKM